MFCRTATFADTRPTRNRKSLESMAEETHAWPSKCEYDVKTCGLADVSSALPVAMKENTSRRVMRQHDVHALTCRKPLDLVVGEWPMVTEKSGLRQSHTFREAATRYLDENQHKRSLERDARALVTVDPYIGELPRRRIAGGINSSGWKAARRRAAKRYETELKRPWMVMLNQT